ncbi:uncharacterized protein [Ambystoma mexicanum]|uniref:uncharacterized protein n=1 Tax=Ambystoma mexicanum TaxID=8296 RepID=UPI0037E81DD0
MTPLKTVSECLWRVSTIIWSSSGLKRSFVRRAAPFYGTFGMMLVLECDGNMLKDAVDSEDAAKAGEFSTALQQFIHTEKFPRTADEFSTTRILMDISVYPDSEPDKETAEDKVIENSAQEDISKTDQKEAEDPIENKTSKRGQNLGCEKQGVNQQDQSRAEHHKENRETNQRKPNRQAPTPKRQRVRSNSKERTRRTSGRERLTRREAKPETTRVFKLEQSSCKSEYIILNRKTVLKALSKIVSLQHLKTDDFTLIEPYHRDQKAKTYLHIKRGAIKKLTNEPYKDLKKAGFTMTEITQENKQDGRSRRVSESESSKRHQTLKIHARENCKRANLGGTKAEESNSYRRQKYRETSRELSRRSENYATFAQKDGSPRKSEQYLKQRLRSEREEDYQKSDTQRSKKDQVNKHENVKKKKCLTKS